MREPTAPAPGFEDFQDDAEETPPEVLETRKKNLREAKAAGRV